MWKNGAKSKMSNLEQSTCQLCVKIVELKQETVVISFLICGISNFYLMAPKMTTSVMITMCRNRLVLSMDVYIFFFCSLLYLYMYFCQIVLVTCTVYCMSHTVYCMTQRLQPRVNNSCLLSSCGCLHAPSSFPPLQITTEPLSYNTGTDIRSWPL